MSFLPLILGGLAVLNPFIGMILMLIYCSYSLRNSIRSPLGSLLLFLVFPVLAAVLAPKMPGVVVMASDALWGVGFAAILFLQALRNRHNLNSAFTQAAILIIIYGAARYFLFGGFLQLANEQTISALNSSFPQIYQNRDMQSSLSLMRYIWPSSWTVPQVVSLFLGFLIFQRLSGVRFNWREVSFPKYYNFLILAILPLYLVPSMQQIFVNTLLALFVIPVIQGLGVLLNLLSRYISNKFVLILLMVILISNLILVALLGFADIWLDFRKLNYKGTIA